MQKLKGSRQKSNFWMFHRVCFEDDTVSDIYRQRGMFHRYKRIIDLIDDALANGFKFGSIIEALKDKNTIHLTFDDGYKEHLKTAKKLKEKYNFSNNCITFSINVRNSFYTDKLSMDLIYKLIDENKFDNFAEFFDRKITDVDEIKGEIFTNKKYVPLLATLNIDLKNYYLDRFEIIELADIFSIASHCETHYWLTALNKNNIIDELKKSKEFLESVLKCQIKTICYPEGKSNTQVREIARNVGYQYGLSISPGTSNYEIGRSIPCR